MRTVAMPPLRVREQAWPFHKYRINADLLYARYKVAAISIKPKKWDKAGNAEKMEAFFREAARQKPHLILATETVLEGHLILDAIWHPERVPALLDIAEPLDGRYMKRFRKLAAALKTCLCFGFLEKAGPAVFNSAVFIDHRGNICGTYHKVSEGSGWDRIWPFYRPGRQVRSFDTPLGRCGVVICSDRWLPILVRTLVLDGAQFLLIPTDGSTGRAQNLTVLARARENGIPVVQANDVGHNLIISKGEIAAYEMGIDRITSGFIHIPRSPGIKAARAAEREFLRFQTKMERAHFQQMIAALRKGTPSRDQARGLVPEHEFQRLRKAHWGEKSKGRHPALRPTKMKA